MKRCTGSLSDKESDGTRQKFPVHSLTNPRPRASDPYSHRSTYTYSLTLGCVRRATFIIRLKLTFICATPNGQSLCDSPFLPGHGQH